MAKNGRFLKGEPISITSLLQLPFALIAICPVVLYQASIKFRINCKYAIPPYYFNTSWGFVDNFFDMRNVTLEVDPCDNPGGNRTTLFDLDLRSHSLAFVGCMAMDISYLLLSLVMYSFCWPSYSKRGRLCNFASLDFVINVALGFACLAVSGYWLYGTLLLRNATTASAIRSSLSPVLPCVNGAGSENCILDYHGWFGVVFITPVTTLETRLVQKGRLEAVGFVAALLHFSLLFCVWRQTPCSKKYRVKPVKVRYVVGALPAINVYKPSTATQKRSVNEERATSPDSLQVPPPSYHTKTRRPKIHRTPSEKKRAAERKAARRKRREEKARTQRSSPEDAYASANSDL